MNDKKAFQILNFKGIFTTFKKSKWGIKDQIVILLIKKQL